MVRGSYRRALNVIAAAVVLVVLLLLLALSSPFGIRRLAALGLPPGALELDRWVEVGQLTVTAAVGTLRAVRNGVSHADWTPWFQQSPEEPLEQLPAAEEEEDQEEDVQAVDTALVIVARLTATAAERLSQWSDWLRGEQSRRRLQTRQGEAVEREAMMQQQAREDWLEHTDEHTGTHFTSVRPTPPPRQGRRKVSTVYTRRCGLGCFAIRVYAQETSSAQVCVCVCECERGSRHAWWCRKTPLVAPAWS